MVCHSQLAEALTNYFISMSLSFLSCKMSIILPAFRRSNICRRVCMMPGHRRQLTDGSDNREVRSFRPPSAGAGCLSPARPPTGRTKPFALHLSPRPKQRPPAPMSLFPDSLAVGESGAVEMPLITLSAAPGHPGRDYSR